MSYLVVNEELRIQSCSIEDLTQEVKDHFVNQFKGDSIETLTIFYDLVTDTIVLNQDNKDYEFYEITATTYLGATYELRKEIKKQAMEINDRFSETFYILDQAVRNRKIKFLKMKYKSEFKIIGEMTAFWKQRDMLDAIDFVDEYDSSYMKLTSAYNWGYIQGVRAERAKRKKVAQ